VNYGKHFVGGKGNEQIKEHYLDSRPLRLRSG